MMDLDDVAHVGGSRQTGAGAVAGAVAVDVAQVPLETGRDASRAVGGAHLAVDEVEQGLDLGGIQTKQGLQVRVAA